MAHFPALGNIGYGKDDKALQRLLAENVKRGCKALAMRAFANLCRLSHGRPRRGLKAKYTGVLLRGQGRGGWMCPEYSALLAQRRAEKAKAAKGRRSVVTNRFAERLVAEGALHTIHTMTTDNGYESLAQPTLKRILHAPWEKGPIGRHNRLLRLHRPKPPTSPS